MYYWLHFSCYFLFGIPILNKDRVNQSLDNDSKKDDNGQNTINNQYVPAWSDLGWIDERQETYHGHYRKCLRKAVQAAAAWDNGVSGKVGPPAESHFQLQVRA